MRQLIYIVQRTLTNRLVLAVLMFLLPQQVSAISPPDSGGFPIEFWEQVNQGESVNYKQKPAAVVSRVERMADAAERGESKRNPAPRVKGPAIPEADRSCEGEQLEVHQLFFSTTLSDSCLIIESIKARIS